MVGAEEFRAIAIELHTHVVDAHPILVAVGFLRIAGIDVAETLLVAASILAFIEGLSVCFLRSERFNRYLYILVGIVGVVAVAGTKSYHLSFHAHFFGNGNALCKLQSVATGFSSGILFVGIETEIYLERGGSLLAIVREGWLARHLYIAGVVGREIAVAAVSSVNTLHLGIFVSIDRKALGQLDDFCGNLGFCLTENFCLVSAFVSPILLGVAIGRGRLMAVAPRLVGVTAGLNDGFFAMLLCFF